MRALRTWVYAWVILSAPVRVLGQTPPLGGEFEVNTYTTGGQRFPAVAVNPSGEFVIGWESDGQDGDLSGVFGEKYNHTGTKDLSEFQANTYITGKQYHPSAGIDDAGNFVVVWESYYQDGSGNGVFGQRFDSSGAKVGPEFPVTTYTSGRQHRPSVAVKGDGSFVVVWGGGTPDNSSFAIDGQRFDASGTKVGSEFQASTYPGGFPDYPSVGVDGGGNFVVAWESPGQDGDGNGVFGQRFDGSGSKVGPEFLVNTNTTADQVRPRIAADHAGNFVVVWESLTSNGLGFGGQAIAQRFNRSGEKVGPEFQVDTSTTQQYYPSVAFERNGGFVVVWDAGASAEADIFGRRFDRSGNALTATFPINTFTILYQKYPSVAADASGGFVVAWNSALQDGSGYGVFAQRSNVAPASLNVDVHGGDGSSSDLNGVLEPEETVVVEPSWRNKLGFTLPMASTTPLFFCLSGFPCVIAGDLSAEYDKLPPDATGSCYRGIAGTCFTVLATGPRPATHWDGFLEEDVSVGGGYSWTLHVGDSFSDVPRSQPFYKKIETLLHNGITSGCTPTSYCPSTIVTRDQMAIFIAKGIAGSGELVPTTGLVSGSAYNCSPGGHSLFTDVASTDSACRHVHYLAAQNVTLGCNPGQYCPTQTITRDAMASFIAKAIVAPGGGNAVPLTYGPDPVTGLSYSCAAGSPNLHFTDVPVSNVFCKHIHYLWAKGIVAGCSATQYCPTQTVARDAMAKFIANGFGLQLYGP